MLLYKDIRMYIQQICTIYYTYYTILQQWLKLNSTVKRFAERESFQAELYYSV